MSHPEGAEFSHEDHAAWEELTVLRGQVVEVPLSETGEDFPPDLWGGFLVVKIELGLEGDMVLHAKSLGCDDPESTRWLSANFNRRPGCLHLCHSYPCEVEGDFTLHVTRLRLFTAEGFARDYMTSAVKKQMRKWIDQLEEEEERPAKGLNITVPALDGEVWEHVEAMKSTAKAHPPTPPGRVEEKISERKREELRKRLDDAKARMSRSTGLGAGLGAELPPERSEEPGSPGYSPSPVEEKDALDKRRQGALRAPPRRSVHEKVEPLEIEDEEERERERRERKKRKAKMAEKPAVLAIKDTSTGSLQTQLLNQAARAAQEKAGRIRGEKEKARKKDPGTMLVKWLQQAAGGGKKKKKKKGKRSQRSDPNKGGNSEGRKRRRRKDPGEPGSSPSSSNGSGQTSGSDLSSNEALEESSSSSEDLRMEPPLRKKARERPGSVLQLLVEHARAQLDQSSKVVIGKESSRDCTSGVKLSSYFSIIIRPQVGSINAQVREMHHLSTCMDALREGALDHVGDLLAARFISLHQSLLDGNWTAARQLELLPLEETSAAGPQLVLQARKQAKLALKVSQPEQWYSPGAGKGRGGRGKGSGWTEWPQEAKGKSKKGGRGKGKGRGCWGQHSDSQEPDPNKKKEKPGDK